MKEKCIIPNGSIVLKIFYVQFWTDQHVNVNFHLSKKVKKNLYESFVENWKLQVHNLSKCSNYRMYKTTFGFENYLTILPQDLLYNVCRFRCSSHKLPIEKGRFLSIDRSERICTLCIFVTNMKWVMNFIIYFTVPILLKQDVDSYLSN